MLAIKKAVIKKQPSAASIWMWALNDMKSPNVWMTAAAAGFAPSFLTSVREIYLLN